MTDDIRLPFVLEKLVHRYQIFLVISILVGLVLAYMAFYESAYRYVSRIEIQSEEFNGKVEFLLNPRAFARDIPGVTREVLHEQLELEPGRPGINVLLQRDLTTVDIMVENDGRTIRLSSTGLESDEASYERFHLGLIGGIRVLADTYWEKRADQLLGEFQSIQKLTIDLNEEIEGRSNKKIRLKFEEERRIRLGFFINMWEGRQKELKARFDDQLYGVPTQGAWEVDESPLLYLMYLSVSQYVDDIYIRYAKASSNVEQLQREISLTDDKILLLEESVKEGNIETISSLNKKFSLAPIRVVGSIAQREEKISRVTLARIAGVIVLGIMGGCLATYIVEGVSTVRRRRSRT